LALGEYYVTVRRAAKGCETPLGRFSTAVCENSV
jgi:hypothetical protein